MVYNYNYIQHSGMSHLKFTELSPNSRSASQEISLPFKVQMGQYYVLNAVMKRTHQWNGVCNHY
jgi:hypothetical protein